MRTMSISMPTEVYTFRNRNCLTWLHTYDALVSTDANHCDDRLGLRENGERFDTHAEMQSAPIQTSPTR